MLFATVALLGCGSSAVEENPLGVGLGPCRASFALEVTNSEWGSLVGLATDGERMLVLDDRELVVFDPATGATTSTIIGDAYPKPTQPLSYHRGLAFWFSSLDASQGVFTHRQSTAGIDQEYVTQPGIAECAVADDDALFFSLRKKEQVFIYRWGHDDEAVEELVHDSLGIGGACEQVGDQLYFDEPNGLVRIAKADGAVSFVPADVGRGKMLEHDGMLYLLGPPNDDDSADDEVWRFDPVSETLELLGRLEGRHASMAVRDGIAYLTRPSTKTDDDDDDAEKPPRDGALLALNLETGKAREVVRGIHARTVHVPQGGVYFSVGVNDGHTHQALYRLEEDCRDQIP